MLKASYFSIKRKTFKNASKSQDLITNLKFNFLGSQGMISVIVNGY